MRSGVTNDPYQAFENMTDEEVVMAAKQDENLMAQEYLLYKYRII